MKRKLDDNSIDDGNSLPKKRKINSLDNVRVTINNNINGQPQAKIYFLDIELDLDELDFDEVIINVKRKQQQ